MRLNADFDQRVVVTPEDYRWVDSPMAGVERMMLDRIGEEVAQATSLVRYAPNSTFPSHEHGGGEEILVLEGVFHDEHGAYPAGSWLRSPHRSQHTPFTGEEGALIYVYRRYFEKRHRAVGQWTRRGRMGIEVGGLLGLIWLIIVIWAIVKVAKSSAGGLAKLLWILVLLFFPLLGLIIWFLLGPKG